MKNRRFSTLKSPFFSSKIADLRMLSFEKNFFCAAGTEEISIKYYKQKKGNSRKWFLVKPFSKHPDVRSCSTRL